MTTTLWNTPILDAFTGLSPAECTSAAIARMTRFHAESEYGTLFSEPLVVSEGATESRVSALESELHSPLPTEYRDFLLHYSVLEMFDGYRVWGLDSGSEQPCLDAVTVPGLPLLVCGDVWHDADGDTLMLDMSTGSTSVWSHDFRVLRPLAPSFSLAIARLVSFLTPDDQSWAQAVETVRHSTRETLARRTTPWWRRAF